MSKPVVLDTLPEVFLTENITKESATRAVEQLAAIRATGAKRAALSIYSDGGDVKAGNFLAKWISNPANGIEVEARVYGNASSAAMIIAASCHSRYIAAGSFANIHFAFAMNAEGEIIEAKDQTTEVREALAAINADQVALFQRVTGKTKAQVEALMRQDRDVPSEKAFEFGLFDGIIPQAAKLAAFKQIPAMAEEKKTFTIKVSAGDALKAIASGSIEVQAEQVETDLKAELAKATALVAELTAKVEASEKAKTDAEAVTAAKVTELETATSELRASKEAIAAYVAKVETLEKTPLKAQTLSDGTAVVIPGGGENKETVKLSAKETHFQRTQGYLAEYDKRKATQAAN